VAKLKEQGGDLLIYGSGELVRTLMRHGLIDVYRIMLYPVALASGKRLFGEGGGDMTTLTLADSKTTSTGVVVLTYQSAESGGDG
jgi:dihydrofolate reductase